MFSSVKNVSYNLFFQRMSYFRNITLHFVGRFLLAFKFYANGYFLRGDFNEAVIHIAEQRSNYAGSVKSTLCIAQ